MAMLVITRWQAMNPALPLCMVSDALVIHGAPGHEEETAATKCLSRCGPEKKAWDAAILTQQCSNIASNILPEYHNDVSSSPK